MEACQKIKKVTCPKCSSSDIEQVGTTKERFIFKCKEKSCSTFWSMLKDEEEIR